MTQSKSKLNTNEIPAFRKFLEARGFKCRDGKGDWQALLVQNITDRGWKAFCFNTKGVVTSPVEFDALIQVFRAPVDSGPSIVFETPTMRAEKIQHDSDLLDDFAIAALQGMLAYPGNEQWGSFAIMTVEDAAKTSYEYAKAMMAERAKHQPK